MVTGQSELKYDTKQEETMEKGGRGSLKLTISKLKREIIDFGLARKRNRI